jgi:peptidoglycan LD-endopeptidase CwlK
VGFAFSPASEAKLANLNDALVRVVRRALSYGVLDITVIETLRTPEEEAQKVAQGLSETQNSKHLEGPDGKSHAVDLAPYPVDWTKIERFRELNDLMQRAALEEGVAIVWGGTWKTLKDFDHWELSEKPVAAVAAVAA